LRSGLTRRYSFVSVIKVKPIGSSSLGNNVSRLAESGLPYIPRCLCHGYFRWSSALNQYLFPRPRLRRKAFMWNRLLATVGCLTAVVHGACVADFPEKLLSDPQVLQHASVVAAFKEVGRNLSSLFVNTTRDALSFAFVGVYKHSFVRNVTNAMCKYMPRRLAR
jgi:hypothetical protein